MTQGNQASRIQEMLDGNIEPPNKFVAYQLTKVKEVRAKITSGQQQVQQTTDLLDRMKNEMLVLQGEHNKCIEDIKAWDKEVLEGGEEQPKEDDHTAEAVEAEG